MSLFDTPNGDAYTISPGQGSRGPQLGFQDAFMASWQAQTRTNSLLGLQQAFQDVEQAQNKKLRERGIEPPPSLDERETRGTGPFGGAQFFGGRYEAAAQSALDGGGWYTDEMVQERDKRLQQIQKDYPDLGVKTYAEMFKDVQEQGKEALARAALPTTFMGAIGGFAGAAAASLNPVADPLNVASFIVTAPMGGPTMLTRAGVQGVAQGVTEAGNIALGPDSKGLITGVPTTTAEEWQRLGFAVAGGAGGQMLAEGIGAGVRRVTTGKWFADVAPDKLPTREIPSPDPTMRAMTEELAYGVERRMPPDRPFAEYPDFEAFARSQGYDLGNPYGATRQAALRHASDLDYVASELDRWDGPSAHAIAARTDTAPPPNVQPGVRYDGAYQRYVDGLENVDDIARRLDSDLFALYDKLERQRAELRTAIDAERDRFARFDGPDTMFEGAAERQRVAEVEARAELQKIDYQMRDLAPLVTRAYAAAEKEWRSGAASDLAFQRFLSGVEQRAGWRYRGEGEPSLAEKPIASKPAPVEPTTTLAEQVPLSVLSPSQQAKLRPGTHDAADRVAIVVRDALDTAETNVDKFMGDVRKTSRLEGAEWIAAKDAANDKLIKAKQLAERTKAENDIEAVKKAQEEVDALTGITLPDGQRLDFNDVMIDANGNKTTVRKFIQEMDADTEALSAVRTCSLPS